MLAACSTTTTETGDGMIERAAPINTGAVSFPEGTMRRGFTLLELLLVVAVIGVLALVAVPRLASAQTGSRLAGAERRMQSEFAAVGELASAQGVTHTIQFHIPSSEMRIYRGTTAAAPALIRTIPFADEPYRTAIVATNITGAHTTIQVDGFGVYSAAATVQIDLGGIVRVVELTAPVAGSASVLEDAEAGGAGLLGDLIKGLLGGLILPGVPA